MCNFHLKRLSIWIITQLKNVDGHSDSSGCLMICRNATIQMMIATMMTNSRIIWVGPWVGIDPRNSNKQYQKWWFSTNIPTFWASKISASMWKQQGSAAETCCEGKFPNRWRSLKANHHPRSPREIPQNYHTLPIYHGLMPLQMGHLMIRKVTYQISDKSHLVKVTSCRFKSHSFTSQDQNQMRIELKS